MKHIENFENFNEGKFIYPKGRQADAAKAITETFTDITEDYEGVRMDVKIEEHEYELIIRIPELLKKNEIKDFYNSIVASKLEYLKSIGINTKWSSERIGISRLFGIEKFYKDMQYETYDDYTKFTIKFKRF